MDFMTWLRAEWDRVAGYSLIVLGGIVLLLGYRGVSNSPYVAEELTYIISGGLGGMFLLGAGATLLISADLHDEWRKLDRIEAAIRAEKAPSDPDHDEPGNGGRDNGHRQDRPADAIVEPSTEVRTRVTSGAAPRVSTSRGWLATVPVVFRRAMAVWCAGLLAAAIVLMIAWHRAANVTDPKPAVSALAIAVVGLVLAGAAALSGTLSLKRAVKQREGRLLARWVLADLSERIPGLLPAESARSSGAGRVLVSRELTHFHRPGCPATNGIKVREVGRDRVPAGLAPCDLCEAR
jgi:hypothetical protein